MFTPEERGRLRSELIELAAQDGRISGGAITGSAAAEREDEWSDIDLALGVATGADVQSVLSDWTTYLYERHHVLHHLDIRTGAWIYRVFLLPSTLQVDLAFVPETEFRPLAPTFRLAFGKAKEAGPFASAAPGGVAGLGWLHALHARSCIARGKLWQAEYMISGVRDHALALACIRAGLPSVHGRGLDQLPKEVTGQFEEALVRRIEPDELGRAFGAAVRGLLNEIRRVDAELAGRLDGAMRELAQDRF